jgi:uncharacterized membrane protein
MNSTILSDKSKGVIGHELRKAEGTTSAGRIVSLDIIRGVVMILMAIDHVRVFSGLPPGGNTPGIFFTRWITHFCAPIFVFLTGTGAYLYGRKHGNIAAVSRYLAVRGMWLVLLEFTFLRFAWTFNFDYAHYLLAGVIWVIGLSMILLAALIHLPKMALTFFGIGLIAAHNLIGPKFAPLLSGKGGWLAQILYFGGPVEIGDGGFTFFVLYSVIPWVGVMAAGYVFGSVMSGEAQRRKRICLWLGTTSLLLFLMFRGFNLYGDPRPWKPASTPKPAVSQSTQIAATPSSGPPRNPMPGWLSFLNTTKYPASLLFLLMTLGPMFLAVAFLEGHSSRPGKILATFGSVPLFYYMLHIPLIHLAAILVSFLRSGGVVPWLFANHPTNNPPPPDGYTWSLPLLYLVFAGVVTLLYFPCRWFARIRREKKSNWLSFL